MNVRDRVKEFRRVRASELKPSPKNWRTHPTAQADALKGILAEVGFAGAVLVRELPDSSLELIDGHLRAETLPDQEIPVLVLDVDEAEAAKLLATYDPLGAMADADGAKLDALLREVNTGNEALASMLTELAAGSGVIPSRLPTDPANDPAAEWAGMPEFEHEDQSAWKTVHVHFKGADDLAAFAKLIGQTVTESTRAVWYPPAEIGRYADKRYADEP